MEYPEIDVKQLTPHPENPKEHDDEQIKEIAESIKGHGWGRPIIISSDYFILAGEGAYLAATQILKLKKVPYKFLEPKRKHDEAEAISYMLADNRIAEKSNWNNAKLEINFTTLKKKRWNTKLTGFTNVNLKGFKENYGEGSGAGKKPTGKLMGKYKEESKQHKGALLEDFGCPPFTVFNSSQGYWQKLKKMWIELIEDHGQVREDVLGEQMGTSIMDPVLAQLLINWFTPQNGTTFDPFAGDTIFGFVSGYLEHPFTGIELREEQVKFNQDKCDEFNLPSNYICEDAVNIDKHLQKETQDLLFSCPPYFDLEIYSDLPNDASNQKNYTDFKNIINKAFTKAIKILKKDRFAVIVVGDIRDKKGYYYKFPDYIKTIFEENNMPLYNEAILINPIGTAMLRARSNFKNRKLVKIHQNILIFYKGDISNIQKNFPKTPQCVDLNEN